MICWSFPEWFWHSTWSWIGLDWLRFGLSNPSYYEDFRANIIEKNRGENVLMNLLERTEMTQDSMYLCNQRFNFQLCLWPKVFLWDILKVFRNQDRSYFGWLLLWSKITIFFYLNRSMIKFPKSFPVNVNLCLHRFYLKTSSLTVKFCWVVPYKHKVYSLKLNCCTQHVEI